MIKQFDKWHKTAPGLVTFGLVELLVAYGFASLAIDRGNPIYYLLTLIFLIGGLQNLFKLIGKFKKHGHHKTS